jgi:uncharacterized protein (TIGR02186 family)
MMARIFLAMAIFLLLAAPAMAQSRDNVTVDLASDHVDITTGFNGTTLSLFGVRHGTGDVAVVVRGPSRTMSVRRKESILGAWMNRVFETYKDVPAYYNYAVSAPLEKLAPPDILRKNGIGTENLQFNKPNSKDENRILFREALLRNKEKQGLFAENPAEIKFISPVFFRADFYIPANTPVGDFEIKAFYFSNGKIKDVKTRQVRVAQVGGAARIHMFARDKSFLYGLSCIFLAVFAGWFSNRVRRG